MLRWNYLAAISCVANAHRIYDTAVARIYKILHCYIASIADKRAGLSMLETAVNGAATKASVVRGGNPCAIHSSVAEATNETSIAKTLADWCRMVETLASWNATTVACDKAWQYGEDSIISDDTIAVIAAGFIQSATARASTHTSRTYGRRAVCKRARHAVTTLCNINDIRPVKTLCAAELPHSRTI
eukprot:COSAG05_NODE_7097_length_856_cov_1.015852_1_plen_187_part_00